MPEGRPEPTQSWLIACSPAAAEKSSLRSTFYHNLSKFMPTRGYVFPWLLPPSAKGESHILQVRRVFLTRASRAEIHAFGNIGTNTMSIPVLIQNREVGTGKLSICASLARVSRFNTHRFWSDSEFNAFRNLTERSTRWSRVSRNWVCQ
jgi:hypothetical protein